MHLIIKCLFSHVSQISLLIYRLMLQDDSIARAALWIQLSSLFWAWSCQAAASTLSRLSFKSFIFRSVLSPKLQFLLHFQLSIAFLVVFVSIKILSSLFAPLLWALCYCVRQTMRQHVVSLLLSPLGLKLEHADLLRSPIQCLMVNITSHVLKPLEQQICPASPIWS